MFILKDPDVFEFNSSFIKAYLVKGESINYVDKHGSKLVYEGGSKLLKILSTLFMDAP